MLIGDKQAKLPTIYWFIPKLHKNPYKFRFIANSSYCTNLSKTLTSALSAIKQHVIKYCNTVYENNSQKIVLVYKKKSSDVLKKLKLRRYEAGSISTYVFSTIYTTLPHDLIKKKLCELIQWTFGRENKLFIVCNDYTSNTENNYTMWSCETVCDALCFLIDSIFI